ncbi:hypothetical protein CSUI_001871 [Cystoisospora suis]|uniref:Uncharacterized protein n=1 Tax=Cystoisospora suis TaxID=483139 RepID=A0A2C6L6X8_9APIC|nr:hypothetical protein CSUI_001871 [Cystoisospora suis]
MFKLLLPVPLCSLLYVSFRVPPVLFKGKTSEVKMEPFPSNSGGCSVCSSFLPEMLLTFPA